MPLDSVTSFSQQAAQDTGLGISGFTWNQTYQECSLVGVLGFLSFPIEECNIEYEQRVIAHEMPGVSGANVESLALKPSKIHVKAIFADGLQRNSQETWNNLYPDQHNKIIATLTDQTNDVMLFTHPTKGFFNVKSVRGVIPMTSDFRNGQYIEFDLIVANTPGDNSKLLQSDETGIASLSATLFDTLYAQNTPPIEVPTGYVTLEQLVSGVRSTIDSTTLFSQQLTFVCNRALYQIRQLKASLDALNDAQWAPNINYLNRVESYVNTVHVGAQLSNNQVHRRPGAPLSTNKPGSKKKVHYVPQTISLAGLCSQLNNTPDQLLSFNPGLSTTVDTGTLVVYNTTVGK